MMQPPFFQRQKRLPCVRGAVERSETEGLTAGSTENSAHNPSVKISDFATSPYTGEALVRLLRIIFFAWHMLYGKPDTLNYKLTSAQVILRRQLIHLCQHILLHANGELFLLILLWNKLCHTITP